MHLGYIVLVSAYKVLSQTTKDRKAETRPVTREHKHWQTSYLS